MESKGRDTKIVTMSIYIWITLSCAFQLAASAPMKEPTPNAEGFGDVIREKKDAQFFTNSNSNNLIHGSNPNSHGIITPFGSRTGPDVIRSPSVPVNFDNRNFQGNGSPIPLLGQNQNNFQSASQLSQNNNNFNGLQQGNLNQANNFLNEQISNARNNFNNFGSLNQNQLNPNNNHIFTSNSLQGGLNAFTNNRFNNDNFRNHQNINHPDQFVNPFEEGRNLNGFIQNHQQQQNQFVSSNLVDNGLQNFESHLASSEDIHTDNDDSSFGISVLSNDGLSNMGITSILPGPLKHTEVIHDSPLFSNINIDNDNSFESFENQVLSTDAFSSNQGGIPLPSSITGSSFSNDHSQGTLSSSQGGIQLPSSITGSSFSNDHSQGNLLSDTNSQNSNSFSSEPFGIVSSNVNTNNDISVLTDAELTTILQQNQHELSSSLQPSLVEENSFPEATLSINEPSLATEDIQTISNALSDLNSEDSSQLNNLLGGLTIGELLMGINGQNGIVVLPMSSAKELTDSHILTSENSGISVRQVSNDDEVAIAASTTTSAPTTRRRPSRRRKPTKPPRHIRTSMSDILYAKGQWIGTLLGGMLDFGRIAVDAFKEHSGSSSRDSYA